MWLSMWRQPLPLRIRQGFEIPSDFQHLWFEKGKDVPKRHALYYVYVARFQAKQNQTQLLLCLADLRNLT